MGLKNKLSKMKNFLFDDGEEEEKPVKKSFRKPLKKEVKEEVYEELDKTSDAKNFYLEDVSEKEEETEVKSRVAKQEKEFKFPEFDDEDFMINSKPEPIINKIAEEKPMLYQGSKKRKEEVKRFKPSPIISPIYGLLDNDGNKVDEVETKEILLKDKDEVSIDDVRKKAFGNIDEELENTMKKLSNKTIEEAESDMEKEEKEIKELSREKAKKSVVVEEESVIKHEITSDDEDDDMILPNVNFKEIDIDLERKKEKEKKKIELSTDDDDDDDATKEQDLFNLIDTMYQEEGKED